MFWSRLKRYMPRGLYGRAALILLLPIVSLQLLVSVVFIQRHYAGVTEQMAGSILLELRFILQEVETAPNTTLAAETAARLGRPLAITLNLAPASGGIPSQDRSNFGDLSGRVLISELRDGLPAIRAFDLTNRRVVQFWIESNRGLIGVSFARTRVSASNPHQLIVIMVILGALLTLISYLFLRNQLRPIKRMAAAATEYGKGRIVPFNPTGAAEVRAAGTAFLDMRNRIERQTQSRTMMLSGISHDLRTPLTRLRLGLSLMDEAEAGPLIGDVDDMQHLVDEFLDFARSDALEDVVPTDPRQFIDQVLSDAKRAGRAVEAGVVDAPQASVVPLRPMAVRRALDNLLGNALRYGNRAVLSLHLSDRTLRFTVEDNGPGIPPDQREEALRPFTRLDPSRNQDRGSGVGLGLAIVSDIARAHGGSLRLAESYELGGLRVDFIIPR